VNQIPNRERNGLGTVRKALSLLEWVARRPTAPTVREAADGLGLNVTTCYHLVNTLSGTGYLVKGADRRLSLGPQVAILYEALHRNLQATQVCLPVVEELRDRTGETSYLSSWDAGEVVLQLVVESPQALRVTGMYPGRRSAAYCRASGKAILAFIPEPERERYLAEHELTPLTPNTITDPDVLRRELHGIAVDGYAIDRQEYELGISCVGAPYFDVWQRVCGAITVSVPLSRFDDARDHVSDLVLAAGERASRLLGYAGPYPRRQAAEAGEPVPR
jgi:DNA-binding IclR family transcriptional regulator